MAKKLNSNSELNNPLINLFLNVAIFVLGMVIVYMAYSIFIKLHKVEKPVIDNGFSGVPSEIIQAEVLNGCGMSGLADRFTDYLRNQNVDVVNSGNYFTFDVKETLVIDRIGNRANAEKIASLLGVKKKNVIQQINEEYFLDVSVVIGKDYFKLKPME